MNQRSTELGPSVITVFRHELACIADRRRMQRIEALSQLGADGDYSKTSVEWAIRAAEAEKLSATELCTRFRHLQAVARLGLATLGHAATAIDEACKTRDRTAGAVQRAAQQLKGSVWELIEKLEEIAATQPPPRSSSSRSRRRRTGSSSAPIAASQHDKPSRERLRLFTAAAAKLLQRRLPPKEATEPPTLDAVQDIAGQVLEVLRQVLQRAFVVRASSQEQEKAAVAPHEDAGANGPAADHWSALKCDAPESEVNSAYQRAQAQGGRLIAADKANAACESLARMIAIFELFPKGTANEAVRTKQVSAAAEIAKSRLQEAVSAAEALCDNLNLSDLQQDLAKWSSKFPAPGAPPNSSAPTAPSQPPTSTASSTGSSVATPPPTPPEPSSEGQYLNAVREHCEQLAEDVFQKIGDRSPRRSDKRWDAECANKIAKGGVKQLAETVISALRWGWELELRTARVVWGIEEELKDKERTIPIKEKELESIRPPSVTGADSGPTSVVAPQSTTPTQPVSNAGPCIQQGPSEGRGNGGQSSPSATGPDIAQLRLQALDQDLVGLAFSGGGIRSATFGLGVLQALGQMRLLRIFDYFSTVSGGGYIGGWLAAWVRREQSLANVEKQLDPSRVEQSTARRVVKVSEEMKGPETKAHDLRAEPVNEEPEPIHHLRAYSRYLAPRKGLYSADTWALGAIYLRNLLINLAMLVPWVFAVIMLTRMLIVGFTFEEPADGWASWLAAGTFLISLICLLYWGYDQRARLHEAARSPTEHATGADRMTRFGGLCLIVGALLLATSAVWLFSYAPYRQEIAAGPSRLRHPLYDYLNKYSPIAGWPTWVKFVTLLGLGAGALSLLAYPVRGASRARHAPRDRGARWIALGSATTVGVVEGMVLLLLALLTYLVEAWGPETKFVLWVAVSGGGALLLPLVLQAAKQDREDTLLHAIWVGVTEAMFVVTVGLFIYWGPAWRAARIFPTSFPAAELFLLLIVVYHLDRLDRKELLRGALGDVVFGAGLGLGIYLALELVIWRAVTDEAAIISFGPPAILGALLIADYLEVLLVGRLMDELEREWRSRVAGFFLIIGCGWLAFFATTLYLPRWLRSQFAVGLSAGGAWAVISLLAARAGQWLQTKTLSKWSIPWLRVVALIGPPLFLVGFLAAVALLGLFLVPNDAIEPLTIGLVVSLALIVLLLFAVRVNLFSLHMLYANRLIRCYLGASRRKRSWAQQVLGPFSGVHDALSWAWRGRGRGAPTNATVGAIARREPTFTDFDPADDLHLQQLRAVGPTSDPKAAGEPAREDKGFRGPYPLINTALNLVATSELAMQDRLAASFLFTPDFCGGPVCGYAQLPRLDEALALGSPDVVTLGRAITISGAAVDPNMRDFHTPPLTALMTLFNTRLGWWLQNPAYFHQQASGPRGSWLRWWLSWLPGASRAGEKWTGRGPGPGLFFLDELFGQTHAKSEYLHLSDGGHFENLGVYELIRRRCRYIVVTDATTDRYATGENLGNLLRLVRTDFGIRIELDTQQLVENQNGRTLWHCAIGLIHYEDVDPQAVTGTLVYLYPSLTGDEPPDVLQYAHVSRTFPHESTLDQFFSEGQFESYRALGHHIATEVFGEAARRMNTESCDPVTAQAVVRQLFTDVRKRWFPAPPVAERNFHRSGELFIAVERALRGEPLARLRRQLYGEAEDASVAGQLTVSPGLAPASADPGAQGTSTTGGALVSPSPSGTERATNLELHMVGEMLQVMEMVWYGLQLDRYHAHPLNRGWMNVFRRWTNTATFHAFWPFLRAEYSQEFVRFCERALNMVPAVAKINRLKPDRAASWFNDLDAMDQELKHEWAPEEESLPWLGTGRYLRNAVAGAYQFANRLSPGIQPLAWRLFLGKMRSPVARRRCCGLICVGPPYRGAGRDLELLIWLRGPYRNAGIGRSCFERALERIDRDLGGHLYDGRQPYRLLTYYPDSSISSADRLARSQWMNFFFDYGFRCVPADAPGARASTITLAREVRERAEPTPTSCP
jgi:hypothetical protein